MQYRALGRTGIRVSQFGLGTMVLGAWGNPDVAQCTRIINRALDAGVNLVDTADTYGDGENETLVGTALRGRRDDVLLCTKFHFPVGNETDPNRRGNSRRWIMTAVEDSLRRLGVDHIDLYQVHRPDPTVAIEETVDALSDLVRAGKIRAWGTSTFPAEELVQAQWAADKRGAIGPHSEQAPYSILARGIERDVLPTCVGSGIGVLTWSPLSGGWLTGKYRRDDPTPAGSRGDTNPDHFDSGNEAKFVAVDALASIADQAGVSLTHMALAWNGVHPGVSSTLIGPRTEEQLSDVLGASEVQLSSDVLDAIDQVVPAGHTINLADTGWSPPGLAVEARRR